MDTKAARAREIQDGIRQVLYHQWNPIGISGLPADEYDSYIGGVYRLLACGASIEQLVEHLTAVEREYFSQEPNMEHLLMTAEDLRKIDVSLEGE